MQKRAVRVFLLALLLAVGAAAAVIAWNTDRRIQRLQLAEEDAAYRIDQLTAAAANIRDAQLTYLASALPDQPVVGQVPTLAQQMAADAAALRPLTRSTDAVAKLQAVADALPGLMEADTGAREHLSFGQQFLAADLVLGPARERLATVEANLRDLRAAEAGAFAAERETLRRQAWTPVAAAALVWTLGLIGLGRAPRPEPSASETTAPSILPCPAPAIEAAPQPFSIDLPGAAALCTDVSRVTTTAALPELLARAAAILDASGVILWMGAGDQLFAAASHGYEARVVSRLGPIARTADNATATAWRTGRLGTVANEGMSSGAIVAPMFSPRYCIGVFAAEVQHGREQDAATRAVTAMIAAQFASAVAAWPAASTTATEPAASREKAAG